MPMVSSKSDKPKDQKGTLARLGKYLWNYKTMLFLALFLTISSNLLALIGPMLSGFAIDAIKPKDVDFSMVFFYCGLMLAFYIISSIMSYFLSMLMINISQKTSQKMRKDVFDKLSSLPIGFFDKYQTGEVISRISYDVNTVNASLSNDLLQICTSIITVGGSFIMMLSISPTLAVIFLVTVPISIFFTKYMAKKVRPLFHARSVKLGELNGFTEEIISGQKTIKAYNQEDTMIGKFSAKNEDAVDAYYKADYYGSIVGPSVNFINNLSLSLISVFGAILFMSGGITLGALSSFVLYSRKFSGPINEFANILSELQSACAAAERIFTLLDELPEKADAPNAKVLENVRGQVTLSHVRFGYSPENSIIHDLSMDLESGSLVAIVGPTGAGKTTLINLLMRFYDVNSGTIFIDGNDIKEVTRDSLRRAYAMVLQDAWLFNGTIHENIAYGKEGATRDEVIAVAKAAKIHNYISHLPDGYDTLLSDEGVNISTGQKQLLTIARAMLPEASMLILDEATSNVDTRTEQKIQVAMRKLMQGKTCFVIAHRLSTIRNADLILLVQNGDVVERGTHDELMKKKGAYKRLYQAQFE